MPQRVSINNRFDGKKSIRENADDAFQSDGGINIFKTADLSYGFKAALVLGEARIRRQIVTLAQAYVRYVRWIYGHDLICCGRVSQKPPW